MMNKQFIVKGLLAIAVTFSLFSCDKDFNTIGSEIVGDDYFDFERETFSVTAYDSVTGPVQANNLNLNSLGVFKNGNNLGTSVSHFVTQVQLPTTNMDFGVNQTVDSVWVYVPYFSTQTGTNTDGIRTYELDSVYGGEAKFSLKIYENGYYLGDFDQNNPLGVSRHYSDERGKVEAYKRGNDGSGNSVVNGMYLNDSNNISENTNFWFNPDEKIIYKTDGAGQYVDASGNILSNQSDITSRVIKERFAPGIWIHLNKDFIRERILKASSNKLVNNNVFTDYFRGLYFKVEEISAGQGAKALLDFSKGYIRVEYSADFDTDNNDETPLVNLDKSMNLALKGNTINFFETDYVLPTGTVADERLYLNGGNGSVAYINVFGEDVDANNIPDNLETIVANDWMINEANLTFYIDNDLMSGVANEPNRIYLYDAKNKKPIIDYSADGSTNSSNPKRNKSGYGGIIEKDESGRGIKYKIRLTEYLKSCINNPDSTNYKLGLVVTENINLSTNAYLRPQVVGEQPKRVVPVSSVINPLGTILHSPTSSNSDKKLKLEIYYTKPE